MTPQMAALLVFIAFMIGGSLGLLLGALCCAMARPEGEL